MRSILLLFLCSCLLALSSLAQLVPYPRYVGDDDHALRLALAASSQSGVQLSLQPFTYSDVAHFVHVLDSAWGLADGRLAWNVGDARQRLDLPSAARPDRADKGWWTRTFYRNPAYAISLSRPGFELQVNPVLALEAGGQSDVIGNLDGVVMRNTRGLSLRGSVDNRVWFSTTIHENQARLASWERQWRREYNDRVPGVGFYKDYDPILFDATDAVDYIQATGEIGFRLTKHIRFLAGHGNPRLGIGYRSMLLDDFVDPYLYAQLDTRVWKLHYRNTYTSMQDGVQSFGRIARKFTVAHQLGVQLTPAWEFGVTEQTVFVRDNGFDAQYLNPVIFYRAVEQDNGSPDNAMIGAYSTLRLGRSGVIYGQFLFDELKVDRLLGGDGWWANKFSFQLGSKLFDVGGIAGLDLNAEFNQVRPFTYAHRRASTAYTHYDQPLAHPWGAGLQEVSAQLKYRLKPSWMIEASHVSLLQSQPSLDEDVSNGVNILRSNELRARDFGYEVLSSVREDKHLTRLRVSWLPVPGASIYLEGSNYAGINALESQQGVRFGLTLNATQRSGVF